MLIFTLAASSAQAAKAASIDAAPAQHRHAEAGAGLANSCQPDSGADRVKIVHTSLAGAPAIERIPTHVEKPPIILWHGFAAPASEAELMQALPLDQVPAVKIYLGLPLFGARAPTRAGDSLQDRQRKDYALLLFKPAVMGAAEELPRVVKALHENGCLRQRDRIGLFGFSASGAAVLVALAERKAPVSVAALVNPAVGLDEAIDALEHATQRPYAWTPESRRVSARSNAITRSGEIAAGEPPPALLLLQGKDDDIISSKGVTSLNDALRPYYRRKLSEQRLKLEMAPGVSHDWTAPGSDQRINDAVGSWFNTYLH